MVKSKKTVIGIAGDFTTEHPVLSFILALVAIVCYFEFDLKKSNKQNTSEVLEIDHKIYATLTALGSDLNSTRDELRNHEIRDYLEKPLGSIKKAHPVGQFIAGISSLKGTQ